MLICGLVAIVAMLSGCGQNTVRQQSTVTVSGIGTVSVEPDMVSMNVSMSKIAPTTRQAQEAVGKMAVRVLEILKEAGIEDKDIKTATLRFNPEYEWRSNRSVLVGQKAEQGIDFAVRNIGQDSDKIARLIDKLVQVDGIVMNQINFNIADKTEHYVHSRELAFEKAAQKAKQYAELSGLRVGRVLSLSENTSDDSAPVYGNRMIKQTMMEFASDESSTVLPSGQMEITTRISAVFSLE
jgi:hypothetical protein